MQFFYCIFPIADFPRKKLIIFEKFTGIDVIFGWEIKTYESTFVIFTLFLIDFFGNAKIIKLSKK